TFTFSSNEPGTFECKLDAGPFALCSSPHQLTGLDDGPHSFTVKAIDNALNEDPSPPVRSFTVDATPPQTTILSGPGRKAKARGKIRFTFSSNEPGSTFSCRLNSKPFRPCSSPFKRRLKKPGRYRFQVRATDAVGHVDPTPAKRAFKVKRVR
ncbi:MAG TPA: hypothetical protein VK919_00610, partial [Solirubrobacterales bacterium]|nr:hypothetical protein [Solirubrobacterales bacterium]